MLLKIIIITKNSPNSPSPYNYYTYDNIPHITYYLYLLSLRLFFVIIDVYKGMFEIHIIKKRPQYDI